MGRGSGVREVGGEGEFHSGGKLRKIFLNEK